MTLAPTFACFGCVDFANNQRTKQYIAWACAQGLFGRCVPPTNWICSCDQDDGVYVDPVTDEACWYDPLIPESADFLGVVIRRVTGLRSSTFTRDLVDAIDRGSILQQPLIRGKQMVFEVLLYATSQQGMNYGIQWMRRQIEGDGRCPQDGSSCASCQGQILTLRVHCADPLSNLDPGLHSWASAGTIDGFSLIEDEYPMGAKCCAIVRAATFTIATEEPDSFSTDPVSTDEVSATDAFTVLGNCLTEAELPTLDDVCCPICNIGCDPCTTDPACDCLPPFILEPEVIGVTAPCFVDPLCRCISAIQVTGLPAGYETSFRMTLQAGLDESNAIFSRSGMRNVVVRIWENPDGFATPVDLATYEALAARYAPCAEVGVSWVPPAGELVLDGLSGRSWLKCDDKCVDHSARVFTISGEVLPLRARCTDIIFTVEWDCMNVQAVDDLPNAIFPSTFTVETFLGFKL